jgi:hypothetical protein
MSNVSSWFGTSMRFDQVIRSSATTEQLDALRQETLNLIGTSNRRSAMKRHFQPRIKVRLLRVPSARVRKHLVTVKQLPEQVSAGAWRQVGGSLE